MRAIVDTCIWSEILRKNNPPDKKILSSMTEIIKEGRVSMIGPIRQELLSGIKQKKQFSKLKKYLQDFPDEKIITHDYEMAAEYFNYCRSKGVQGSNTDFLICSIANRLEYSIFSNDRDFLNYKKHLNINLL